MITLMFTELLPELRDIVGPENLLSEADERLVYECDGYVVEKRIPDLVVFPTSADQVERIVEVCRRYKVPFVPAERGPAWRGAH